LSRSEAKNATRRGAIFSTSLLCFLFALVVLSLSLKANAAAAVTPTQVSNANGQIQSAFASVYAAEKSGGNVSALDARLNYAIQLVQKAEAENATNPAQAGADLQNATAVAQGVAAESPSVGQAGSAARQATELTSAGGASAIVTVAALTYVFGGRIYRKAWLRLHRDYVVRPANG
jgi:hypothetical protein